MSPETRDVLNGFLVGVAALAIMVAFALPLWAAIAYDYETTNDRITWVAGIGTVEALIVVFVACLYLSFENEAAKRAAEEGERQQFRRIADDLRERKKEQAR